MNAPLQIIQPPNAVEEFRGATDWKAVVAKVSAVAKWSKDFTNWVSTQALGPTQRKVNGLTSGFSSAASGGTVQLSTAITHVTGTNAISTITPGPGFSGVAWLVADGAFSLTTGGNIALAGGPYSVGQHVAVIFDSSTGLWYPA